MGNHQEESLMFNGKSFDRVCDNYSVKIQKKFRKGSSKNEFDQKVLRNACVNALHP